MSRTYKDQKQNKIRSRLLKDPQLKTRYSEIKTHGFKEDFGSDQCPDCGGKCEYETGYFTCSECGWGDFTGTKKDDVFGEVSFRGAA